jgi:hypothetical protein
LLPRIRHAIQFPAILQDLTNHAHFRTQTGSSEDEGGDDPFEPIPDPAGGPTPAGGGGGPAGAGAAGPRGGGPPRSMEEMLQGMFEKARPLESSLCHIFQLSVAMLAGGYAHQRPYAFPPSLSRALSHTLILSPFHSLFLSSSLSPSLSFSLPI